MTATRPRPLSFQEEVHRYIALCGGRVDKDRVLVDRDLVERLNSEVERDRAKAEVELAFLHVYHTFASQVPVEASPIERSRNGFLSRLRATFMNAQRDDDVVASAPVQAAESAFASPPPEDTAVQPGLTEHDREPWAKAEASISDCVRAGGPPGFAPVAPQTHQASGRRHLVSGDEAGRRQELLLKALFQKYNEMHREWKAAGRTGKLTDVAVVTAFLKEMGGSGRKWEAIGCSGKRGPATLANLISKHRQQYAHCDAV